MKNKPEIMFGVIIFTIIEIILLVIINTNFYKGIFNFSLVIPIIVLQVVVTYNFLRDRLKTKKPRLWLLFFFSVPIIIFIVGKPTYTFKQAEQLVLDEYGDEISIVDNGEEKFRDTVPIYTEDHRIFITDRDYHFKGVTEKKEQRYFLVNPRTGEVIEMSQPYWQESYE
ncbi:hypothetical protein AB685_10675 [Bacillus sp. LL01]|uniref:hypothetical protein n=1 Tax=Bacillus sp. LL01 TaxID=1665556 RepID=UPI00064CDF6F|nr:hypothetical protein [Bacillus sp. LL01]KMJ58354.1 hypothetical protein AB685_10675 [Bacillus sp. LL01]